MGTMTDSPAETALLTLPGLALAYSPILDTRWQVAGVRLSVFAHTPEQPPEPAMLLAAVQSVWGAQARTVTLGITSEPMLRALIEDTTPTEVTLEVPAFIAADPAMLPVLQAARQRGRSMLLRVRPLAGLPHGATALPEAVLACFQRAIVDADDDRRGGAPAPAGARRTLPFLQDGIVTTAQGEQALRAGAVGFVGWPIPEPGPRPSKAAATLQTVTSLIRGLDQDEALERLEARLKTDPSLAFRLMRYINSPAFGLSVEITSFRHAIMILGYQRMKRWLALLLATAADEPALRPVMFASVRRGLLLEALTRDHADETLRNELFICGVFSLLDRLMGQPFKDLLTSVPMPERVSQALIDEDGPYLPYLAVARAVETGTLFDLRDAADALLITTSEINHALLKSLDTARQLS
jgi:c-di-GMP phosphodiesterase